MFILLIKISTSMQPSDSGLQYYHLQLIIYNILFVDIQARYFFQQLISGVSYCHYMVKNIFKELHTFMHAFMCSCANFLMHKFWHSHLFTNDLFWLHCAKKLDTHIRHLSEVSPSFSCISFI